MEYSKWLTTGLAAVAAVAAIFAGGRLVAIGPGVECRTIALGVPLPGALYAAPQEAGRQFALSSSNRVVWIP